MRSIIFPVFVLLTVPFMWAQSDPLKEAYEVGERIEGWRKKLRASSNPEEVAKAFKKQEAALPKPLALHTRDLSEIDSAAKDVIAERKGLNPIVKVVPVNSLSWRNYIHLAQSSDFNDRLKAAKFGYSYDSGKETYTAKGAIIVGYFTTDYGQEPGWVADYWFGNDFDLSTDKVKNPGKITNRFSMLVRKKLYRGDAEEPSIRFLPTLLHEANRNFKTKSLLGQVLAEPAGCFFGLPINLAVETGAGGVQFGPQLGFELGSAIDKMKDSSPEDGGFWRNVIKLNFQLYPAFASNKLLLFAQHTTRFLQDNRDRDYNLLKAGFEYEIAEPVSLSFDYSIGRDSPTFEQIRTVSVGLGLRF